MNRRQFFTGATAALALAQIPAPVLGAETRITVELSIDGVEWRTVGSALRSDIVAVSGLLRDAAWEGWEDAMIFGRSMSRIWTEAEEVLGFTVLPSIPLERST